MWRIHVRIILIPDEKWFAKKYKLFFIGITDSQWFAKTKIRKPLAIEYNLHHDRFFLFHTYKK